MSEEFFLSGRPWPHDDAPAVIDFDAETRPTEPAPASAQAQDCGECDPEFSCYGSLTGCIRAPRPRPRTRLPADSAERKRVPLATGVFDYMPAAIDALVCRDGVIEQDLWVSYVAIGVVERGNEWDRTDAFFSALCLLQAEVAPPCDPGTLERFPDSYEDLITRFGDALVEIARVSWHGNEKHNPGQPLHHARWKSMDHADTILRHLFERGGFDGAMRHTACLAWRCGVLDQEMREAEGAPLARGARLRPEDVK